MVQTHQDVKRARQCLFPLRRLKRFVMGPQILKNIYSCTVESIRSSCIAAWYGNCSASDRKALQRVVCTVQYITGAKLPAIQDIYARQFQRKAQNIVKDSSHTGHRLYGTSAKVHLPTEQQPHTAKATQEWIRNKSQCP